MGVLVAGTGRRIRTAPAGDPEGASLWRSLRREGIVVRCVCATWVRVVGDSIQGGFFATSRFPGKSGNFRPRADTHFAQAKCVSSK